jgi:ligand-binding SRPBCC domain-containing protein
MISIQFCKETEIQASSEEVFAFHECPDALTQLIPPWENVRVVESSGSLHVGSRVVLAGKVLGVIPVRWVAEHVEYDPPNCFADIQSSGPFRSWYHRHLMISTERGTTILRDEVDYQLPMAWLGRYLVGKAKTPGHA